MRWKVLVSATYLQPAINRYLPLFVEQGIEVVLPPVHERMEEAELLSWVGDIDGAICGDDRFTAHVLEAAPRLKVISKWGTGIDSIDQAACRRLGIVVRNTPNAFSEPVADTVLGYLLCFARSLLTLDRHMKAGVWQKAPGRALRECTLGVIGVGNVGKAVVRRAVAFGMRVLGNDPVAMPADFLAATGIEMVSKDELLRQADFVSLNCDLNPTSFHLMDALAFAVMKPDAVIINIARGPIIEEPALIAALQAGQIVGAALDVFEEEPLPADSPLRWMDNVLLAPHNANASPEAWERVHQNTIKNLIDALNEAQ
ncbi:MAG: phosphoglycerate dehydrogenase [Synechococcaceae cyanobacterium SM1_2_3]|nr:phosphoglycerate dehydrogenase [Synechococcaceae cyanobacterium SM1_2_3]